MNLVDRGAGSYASEPVARGRGARDGGGGSEGPRRRERRGGRDGPEGELGTTSEELGQTFLGSAKLLGSVSPKFGIFEDDLPNLENYFQGSLLALVHIVAPPTHDRNAPEPRDAWPSPTSQLVTIERFEGPASRAAEA